MSGGWRKGGARRTWNQPAKPARSSGNSDSKKGSDSDKGSKSNKDKGRNKGRD